LPVISRERYAYSENRHSAMTAMEEISVERRPRWSQDEKLDRGGVVAARQDGIASRARTRHRARPAVYLAAPVACASDCAC